MRGAVNSTNARRRVDLRREHEPHTKRADCDRNPRVALKTYDVGGGGMESPSFGGRHVGQIRYLIISSLNTGYFDVIFSNSEIGASLLMDICGRAPGACCK